MTRTTRLHTRKGFTLIELLVVVAIIGILSAVIFIILGTPEAQATDAGIKSNEETVTQQAEEYVDSHSGSYGTPVAVQNSAISSMTAYNAHGTNFFVADASTNASMAQAIHLGGYGAYAIGEGGSTYAAAVRLSNQTSWWCVDSSGEATSVAEISGGLGSLLATAGVVTSPSLGGGSTHIAVCP